MMVGDPLRPFVPDERRPWTRALAAHLLRRAGFCPSESEIRTATENGPQRTVGDLIGGPERSQGHDELDAMGERLAAANKINRLRAWWLRRMALTSRPLAMRLSVFWHGHFATSNAKVRSAPMMLSQLRTIEDHALGSFADLLGAMSRDPAMIVWLDSGANVKGRPNENFARELFELFSLGIGNYTEADIKESARAFTGFSQRQGRFTFSRLSHDGGVKTVLGERGNLAGEDVIRICLQNPACARLIATKLLREFLTPDPDPALVEGIARRLRDTGYDLAQTMGTLLTSEAMFDERYARVHIKSPVELVLGLVRSLELSPPATLLANTVSQMGQRLLEPASVKGWDGGRSWINATTMLVRMNAGIAATTPYAPAGFSPGELRTRYSLGDRDSIIAFCSDLAMDGQMPEALRDRLDAIDERGDDLLIQAMRVLVTSPEYQLG